MNSAAHTVNHLRGGGGRQKRRRKRIGRSEEGGGGGGGGGGGERGGEEGGCSELAPSPPPLLGSAQWMITSDCLLPDFTAELRRITTIFKNLQSKEEYETCMEEHSFKKKINNDL